MPQTEEADDLDVEEGHLVADESEQDMRRGTPGYRVQWSHQLLDSGYRVQWSHQLLDSACFGLIVDRCQRSNCISVKIL
jgi:hypothetical protein